MQAIRLTTPSTLARSTLRPSTLRFSSPSSPFLLSSRSYATTPGQADHEALQAKQLKLVEKAGRMKQNMGAVRPVSLHSLKRLFDEDLGADLRL
jgi:hypothetical protein